jgi:cytochrome b involved in lipid metabolism
LNEHPGGRKVLLKHAGTDASKQFDAFHSPATLDKYGPTYYIGDLGNTPKPPTELDQASSGQGTTDLFGDVRFKFDLPC